MEFNSGFKGLRQGVELLNGRHPY